MMHENKISKRLQQRFKAHVDEAQAQIERRLYGVYSARGEEYRPLPAGHLLEVAAAMHGYPTYRRCIADGFTGRLIGLPMVKQKCDGETLAATRAQIIGLAKDVAEVVVDELSREFFKPEVD